MGFKELIELEDFFKNLFDVDQIDLVNQAYINPIVAFDIEKSVIYV